MDDDAENHLQSHIPPIPRHCRNPTAGQTRSCVDNTEEAQRTAIGSKNAPNSRSAVTPQLHVHVCPSLNALDVDAKNRFFVLFSLDKRYTASFTNQATTQRKLHNQKQEHARRNEGTVTRPPSIASSQLTRTANTSCHLSCLYIHQPAYLSIYRIKQLPSSQHHI